MNDQEWLRLVTAFAEIEIQSLRVRHECGRDDISDKIESLLKVMRAIVGYRRYVRSVITITGREDRS